MGETLKNTTIMIEMQSDFRNIIKTKLTKKLTYPAQSVSCLYISTAFSTGFV